MKHKFHWLNPKLTVKKTNKCGFGTFTEQQINKGELLLVLSGFVMRLQDEEKLPGSLSDNGIQITEDLSICASKKEELGGINFFNHSCNPNAGIRGQIFLVAMRKIRPNEEVTFDYAMTLHQAKNVKPYKMKCLCEDKNCRGTITDNDWKNIELQDKYDGYFQYFIQEKIDAQKKRN